MNCANFWKKSISFLLTFLVGFIVVNLNLFLPDSSEISNELVPSPNLEKFQSSQTPEKKLECVSAAPNLKYKHLSGTDNIESSKVDKKSNEVKEAVSDDLKKKMKELEKEFREVEELIKEQKKINKYPEPMNLLYIEKCREIK